MKKTINLNKLLLKPSTNYERFHLRTKIKTPPVLPAEKDLPKEWKKIYYKSYPRLAEIILPHPTYKNAMNLKSIFLKRSSKREFNGNPISSQKLSNLLYYSAGIRKNIKPGINGRFYPSAGGRYPLEVYLLIQNADIPQGLYHYYLKSHSLEKLTHLERDDIKHLFFHSWVHTAPCIIIITAMFNRMTVKYGDRGYRLTFLEAGHIAQNFYLQAVANNMNCCAIDCYFDDKLNDFLEIDSINETIVYALTIGNE